MIRGSLVARLVPMDYTPTKFWVELKPEATTWLVSIITKHALVERRDVLRLRRLAKLKPKSFLQYATQVMTAVDLKQPIPAIPNREVASSWLGGKNLYPLHWTHYRSCRGCSDDCIVD